MLLANRYHESGGVDWGLLYLILACLRAVMTNSSSPVSEGVRLGEENCPLMVSYTESARGMIEAAEQPEHWQDKEILFESAEAPT